MKCLACRVHQHRGKWKGRQQDDRIHGKKGIAILEERQDAHNNTFYSIVTAYPGQKVYGNLVGTLPARAAPDQGITQK
jgi:hypothetical protein